jgi:predicted metal-dependent HD superfamily phosphohydrolase
MLIAFINACAKNYRGEERPFHNMAHVGVVLTHLQGLCYPTVEQNLAVWAHAIHVSANRMEDKALNVEFARCILERFMMPERKINLVCEILLSTYDHIPRTGAGGLDIPVIDADLSYLASKWGVYERMIKSLRAEFEDVRCNWAGERRNYLMAMLNRKMIYYTDMGKELWESRARDNMAKELSLC